MQKGKQTFITLIRQWKEGGEGGREKRNHGAKRTWYENTWNPGTCAYQTSADGNHECGALVIMTVLFVVNSVKLHLTAFNQCSMIKFTK